MILVTLIRAQSVMARLALEFWHLSLLPFHYDHRAPKNLKLVT